MGKWCARSLKADTPPVADAKSCSTSSLRAAAKHDAPCHHPACNVRCACTVGCPIRPLHADSH
eukprot:2130954-Alexandrium_andersonii.AAC.1